MRRGAVTGIVLAVAVLLARPAAAGAQEGYPGPQEEPLRWSLTEGLRYEDRARGITSHLGGIFALDYVDYDSRNQRDSEFRFGRAVIVLDGTYGEDFSWRGELDLLGVETEYGFDELWGSFEFRPGMRLTAGLLEIPLGAESSIPEEDLSFTNYAFPAYLDHRTDWAVRLDGELNGGALYYDVTLALGEAFDRFGQRREDPQVSARVVFYPFSAEGPASHIGEAVLPLAGVFAGLGAAYTPSFRGELDIATPADSKVFHLPELRAGSSRFFHVSGGADLLFVRVMGDLVRGGLMDLDTPQGERDLDDQITAWQLQVSWMVTGETYDTRPYRLRDGRPKPFPAQPIWPAVEGEGWGALELAARYSNADVDREFFDLGFTDYNTSSQEFRSITGAVSWYPTPNARATIEVIRSIVDDDPAELGGQGRDTTVIFRV
ncbi:MAG: porin, partial [Planctomycetota bacterium]